MGRWHWSVGRPILPTLFWRKRILLHRAIGNVLIAVGAIMPAFGALFSRLQIPGAPYSGEFFRRSLAAC